MKYKNYKNSGGCKHAVAVLAWLQRRSSDPPSTAVTCYWTERTLALVGTEIKGICLVQESKTAKKLPLKKRLKIIKISCLMC